MKRLLLLVSISACVALQGQNPTWSDDIACIVYSHCSSCHNPNGSAPFSLLTYSDAVNNASYINIKVASKQMPPWPVDNAYQKFAHDRSLTDQEIASIVRWVNTGMAQGNTANAPPIPTYSSNLQIPNPDLKLKIPTYTLPTINQDLYRCFVLPTGLSVQKFITGIEIIPGNHNIVHHAQVFYDTTGISTTLDNLDAGPGYTSPGGIGTNKGVLLGTWVPGSSPIFVPNGMGKLLPPSAKIVVQIHYPEYASGQTDSTKVNFLFTSNSVRNINDAAVLNHSVGMVNGPLYIPKNTVKTFYEQFTVPLNATILNIGPHGHLICRSMKAYGITLLGDTIHLVNIPNWDFHWQGSYDFKTPLKIPFGTKLIGEATYDNTSNNPHNPNNPPVDVNVGESTTDEMMLFYFSFLAYQSGDENIVVDTAMHAPHYLSCVSNDKSSIGDLRFNDKFSIYPNPANGYVNIFVTDNSAFEVSIYDMYGKLIYIANSISRISTADFASGVYTLRLQSSDAIKDIKLLIE